MEFLVDIQQNHNNPEGLEALYQFSKKEKSDEVFKTAMFTCYEQTPGNVLFEAWYHRLIQPEPEPKTIEREIHWKAAIPLAILNGLVLFFLSNSDFRLVDRIPAINLYAAPTAAIAIMAYLVISGKREKKRPIGISVGVAMLAFYAVLITPILPLNLHQAYINMAIPHVALLAWVGIGWNVLGRQSESRAKLAFILKSFEVLVSAGLFAIAGGVFSGVAISMITTLGVNIPEQVFQLILAGGGGVVLVISVASVYDPLRGPLEQLFGQGVSRLMPTLVRLLLPASVVVLLIYIGLIPFNFRAPIENRDLLIINNGMLFAIMGLLMGATPLNEEDLKPQLRIWMRRGIITVAGLAVIISLYALTAILVRAFGGAFIINRTIVIGWNIANLSILLNLLYNQFRKGTNWVDALHKTFSRGSLIYLIWALFVVLGIPLLFQ